MIRNVAIVVFTHSNYSDVWPIFFGQAAKYLGKFKIYLFVDKHMEGIPDDVEVILYDENDDYQTRFATCLQQVEEQYVILHHEDMPLYAEPNIDRIKDYVHMIAKHQFDSVKLLKGGEMNGTPHKDLKELILIPSSSSWLFSIQPTIWERDKLQLIYDETQGNTIWEFEVNAQQICRNHKMKNYYYYDGEPKRGRYHFDSKVYPYIATAVSKGKWVMSEYPKELGQLLKEYNIDPSVRGTK
jgi:hypothetical protein